MEYIGVFKCLCEKIRLRILNILIDGPLCVCHIQAILEEPQPKVSRQLNYLKAHGCVVSERHFNWTIYRIPETPHPVLSQNLACLQDIRLEDSQFRADLEKRSTVIESIIASDTEWMNQVIIK